MIAPQPEEIESAAEMLRAGGLVAFPTETVYGLGAIATDDIAVQRIFSVKRRPNEHPVIVHLADAEQVGEFAATWPAEAALLAAAFWPGPLTLVLPRRSGVATAASAGYPTIAVRVPAHPVALELLRRVGTGIAAPSANRFSNVSPTTAAHVWDDLGFDVEMILDGGPCDSGIESTIVECGSEIRVLRLGGLPAEALAECLGRDHIEIGGFTPAPGTHRRHYAPRARVMVLDHPHGLGAVANEPDVHVIGLNRDLEACPNPAFAAESLEAFARNLYSQLRLADDRGARLIVAVAPSGDGLAASIRDRLSRASAR